MMVDVMFKIVHVGESGIAKSKKKTKVYNIFYKRIGFLNLFSTWWKIPAPKVTDSFLFTEKELVEFFTSQIVKNNMVTYIK